MTAPMWKDPHSVLGPHELLAGSGRWQIRIWKPDAESVTVLLGEGDQRPARPAIQPGLFVADVASTGVPIYRIRVRYGSGAEYEMEDPYRFWPTLGPVDLFLVGEGNHRRLWEVLGARPRVHDGVSGTSFAVWAPNAQSVRVVGGFNSWDGRLHPMRMLGSSGVWELFVPGVGVGSVYKYEVVGVDGRLMLRADPLARRTERPPANASVVDATDYSWGDGEWMNARRQRAPVGEATMRVYEVHIGSWRAGLGYRELADQLCEYVSSMGFTHVELLPVAEHPFGPSWGYQVTGYYAPSARWGSPDDLRYFVDTLHQAGIGVIVDWVPAHFPKDDWALSRFDGTALYEHHDPRRGDHPDWGTHVFNYGRNEVRNFLVANALYWLHDYHIDGLRVDAVASMLYLDYSREPGEWIPNQFGGRENLEAISFLREMNTIVHGEAPGIVTVAEESTSWPMVSRPVESGGLGFTHKWNMGWMHDTLEYFKNDSVHRRWHHRSLTFGMLYAHTENFVLPLSHDEVVHGKGSLAYKMPGDRWQQIANLRALFGWMWAYPGGKLLFMGGEIAQSAEWSESKSLDWWLLDFPEHRGVQELVRRLNGVHDEWPALWQRDGDPAGFQWLDADDADRSVYSFLRWGSDGNEAVLCIANLTPVPRDANTVGVPWTGLWTTLINTDDARFGGSGYGATDSVWAHAGAYQHQPANIQLTLPPLSVVLIGGRRTR